MNSSEVFGVIQQVAATTKSKEKQSIIQSHAGDDLFKKVIYYALNPQFVYGIIPNSSWGVKGDLYESRQDDFSDKTFQILDDLVARNLTGHAARDAIVEHLYSLNDASVELFIRIIRKDFRAGFSESTANKIWKGLIPKSPYMRCLSDSWMIECDDGICRTISDIVDNDLNVCVKSVDKDGYKSYKPITNKFNNGYCSDDWYVITYIDDDGCVKKTKPLTKNHLLFTVDMNEKRVDELNIGDQLF